MKNGMKGETHEDIECRYGISSRVMSYETHKLKRKIIWKKDLAGTEEIIILISILVNIGISSINVYQSW